MIIVYWLNKNGGWCEVGSSFEYQLKEKQLEAMATFVSGRDVFVSLPTGYGKLAIYALLPMVFDKIKS